MADDKQEPMEAQEEKEHEEAPINDIDFGPNAIDISLDKNRGIFKEILRKGTGEEKPGNGDTVYVHYVGTLLDGTKFDSSRDRNEQFSFELGKGKVIKGWDVGVATMVKGELARLICRPEYAYGKMGSGPVIGPNATLIFEVELFSWKGEDLSPDDDGSIQRSSIEAGEGYEKPNDGATVEVHLVGKYEGKVFEERDVQFVVGEASDANVIEGVDIAIKKFKQGEQSRLTIQPKFAFGQEGNKEFNIPENATVTYDVTCKSFEKAKESWQMDIDEKLEQSEIAKTKGTNFFKAGQYQKAIRYYQKIVDYLEQEENLEKEQAEKQKSLLLAAHLNLAMCHIKLEQALEATHSCDKALELDDKNEKGLFRRGQARMKLQDFTLAVKDFEAVLDIDPNNKAAKNQVTIANTKLKQIKDKQKKIFGGMFEKFAKEDAKNEKLNQYKGLNEIGVWDNKMADGMLTLEQEMEAFGEKMPERKDYRNMKDDDD